MERATPRLGPVRGKGLLRQPDVDEASATRPRPTARQDGSSFFFQLDYLCSFKYGRTMPVGVPRAGDTKFEVLTAVSDHWKTARFGPTVAEIRDSVGLSSRSAVQFHINDLVEGDYLDHVPGKRRTLKTTRKGELLVELVNQLESM